MISSKTLLNINENKEEEFYSVLQEWKRYTASSALKGAAKVYSRRDYIYSKRG
ncbi:hypothetical protein [Clostridium estertheticum]|uniref:hypothetical protein n=1 Tax=Clostridium estertheticum TaxID=238834 RepID=UPI001FACF1DA|nr:hypothetical protein [Clostridium estertheticum]WBL49337.1 hypothetical protein LOR37_01165 [Clostridium estertheticum]